MCRNVYGFGSPKAPYDLHKFRISFAYAVFGRRRVRVYAHRDDERYASVGAHKRAPYGWSLEQAIVIVDFPIDLSALQYLFYFRLLCRLLFSHSDRIGSYGN